MGQRVGDISGETVSESIEQYVEEIEQGVADLSLVVHRSSG